MAMQCELPNESSGRIITVLSLFSSYLSWLNLLFFVLCCSYHKFYPDEHGIPLTGRLPNFYIFYPAVLLTAVVIDNSCV
jgi:hypothetical protein